LQRCWFTLAWKVEPSDDQPSCPVFFLLAKFQFSPKGEVKKFKNKKMKWIFEFDLPESEKNSLKSSKNYKICLSYLIYSQGLAKSS
jgi:hypothetical protein